MWQSRTSHEKYSLENIRLRAPILIFSRSDAGTPYHGNFARNGEHRNTTPKDDNSALNQDCVCLPHHVFQTRETSFQPIGEAAVSASTTETCRGWNHNSKQPLPINEFFIRAQWEQHGFKMIPTSMYNWRWHHPPLQVVLCWIHCEWLLGRDTDFLIILMERICLLNRHDKKVTRRRVVVVAVRWEWRRQQQQQQQERWFPWMIGGALTVSDIISSTWSQTTGTRMGPTARIVYETQVHGDAVHYPRTLAMKSEMYRRSGQYEKGLKTHS